MLDYEQADAGEDAAVIGHGWSTLDRGSSEQDDIAGHEMQHTLWDIHDRPVSSLNLMP